MRIAERVGGRAADGHLCVTDAMRGWLAENWGLNAATLHDCPPAFFKRLSPKERHAFFLHSQSSGLFAEATSQFGVPTTEGLSTLFTASDGTPREDRPALLVSSTSWTPDEDFGLLYDALIEIDSAALAAEGVRYESLSLSF
jgi:beta-1,4-mannosyltransferase